MRTFLAGLLVVAAGATSPSQFHAQPDPQAAMWVNLRPSDPQAEVGASHGVLRRELYLGGGWIGIKAMPALEGTPSAARDFRVRAWREGDKARIVVSAVLTDARAPKGETETPIATVALGLGEAAEVAETEAWGAKPFRLNVSTEQFGYQ